MSKANILRSVRTLLLQTGAFDSHEIETIMQRILQPSRQYNSVQEFIRNDFGKYPPNWDLETVVFNLGMKLVGGAM